MSVSIHGTNGVTFNDGSLQKTSAQTGFRNRIINGDMRIDQRNAGASQGISSRAYSIDRFTAQASGATITGQRIADTTGGRLFYYQLNGAASVTQINFEQKIESVNCFDLAGGNITISADISNSLLTTVSFDLYAATTLDSFPGSTLVSNVSWTVSPTMQRYSATIAIPSGSSYQNGLWAVFYVGAQTSGTWKIANIQLEAGSIATDFERRPIGAELALCQRYYETSYPIGTAVGTATEVNSAYHYMMALSGVATTAQIYVPLKATKRAAPTIVMYSGVSGASGKVYEYNGSSDRAALSQFIGTNSFVGYSASLTGSNNVNFGFQWTASSEL